MNLSKVRTIIGWVLAILLALAFFAASAGKLTGAATKMFAHWGYPAWFAIFIGVCELAGGIGLIIPKTTRYAVPGLTVIMFGAAYTHLANHEGLQVLRPAIFLVLLWAVWWLRWKPVKQTTHVNVKLALVIALLVVFATTSRALIGANASSTMQELKAPPQQQPSAKQEEKPAPSNPSPKQAAPSPEIKPADAGMNVDVILEKYVQALGGKVAMERVTTRVMKGNLVTQGGMSAPLEVCEKAPNKTFTTFRTPRGVTLMGYNGEIGWTKAPEVGLRELSGLELNFRRFEAEFHKNLKIKERYPKLNLIGIAKLGDREAYAVEATSSDDNLETWYFDAQSGLLVRIDAILGPPGQKTMIQTYLEDYRDVTGVKMPFAIRRARPGFTWTYKFDEIKLNLPVDDAKFNKPASQ